MKNPIGREEPFVWYGIVSTKIPCRMGVGMRNSLLVGISEPSACGSLEPPNPAEALPLFRRVSLFAAGAPKNVNFSHLMLFFNKKNFLKIFNFFPKNT